MGSGRKAYKLLIGQQAKISTRIKKYDEISGIKYVKGEVYISVWKGKVKFNDF